MQQRKRGFTTEEAARYIGRSKSYLDHLRITGPSFSTLSTKR